MKVGACQICGGPTPPHSNPGKVRKSCDKPECVYEVRAAAARKAHAAYMKNHDVQNRTSYRCSACGVEKPLTTEHFYADRRDPETGEVLQWARWCILCKRGKSRVANISPEQVQRRRVSAKRKYRRRKLRLASDPVGLAEARAKDSSQSRRWRKRNPAKARASQRRYLAKVRANPRLHRAMLERNRMAEKLRRERSGIPLDAQRSGKTLHDFRERSAPELPARPLADVIERRVARAQSPNREEVCDQLGIVSRTLYAWRTGERRSCLFREADAVLVGLALNWWDVWYCDLHGGDDPDCELCRGVRLAERAFEGSESDWRVA